MDASKHVERGVQTVRFRLLHDVLAPREKPPSVGMSRLVFAELVELLIFRVGIVLRVVPEHGDLPGHVILSGRLDITICVEHVGPTELVSEVVVRCVWALIHRRYEIFGGLNRKNADVDETVTRLEEQWRVLCELFGPDRAKREA